MRSSPSVPGPEHAHARAAVASRVVDDRAESTHMSFAPPTTRKAGARDWAVRLVQKTGACGNVCLGQSRGRCAALFTTIAIQYSGQ